MDSEPVVAICDACVLYPFHQRNILVQVSLDGLFDARWTDEIHDEWMRNLLADNPAIPPERLQITRRLMETALPGARVDGFHHRIDALHLPDPDDRHVMAAAIEAKASMILTWNLRDFPAASLKEHGLACQNPDTFLVSLYDLSPQSFMASMANARKNLSRSRVSTIDFLEILRNQKLIQLDRRLKKHVADI